MRFILRLFTHMTHPGVGHIQHHRKAMCFTTMAQDSKVIAIQHKEKVAQKKVASHTALASDAAWRESLAESRLPRVCGRAAASGESLAESRLPRVACRRVCGRMLRGESRLGRVVASRQLGESRLPRVCGQATAWRLGRQSQANKFVVSLFFFVRALLLLV